MKRTSRWHRLISLAVSLGLIWQSAAPAGAGVMPAQPLPQASRSMDAPAAPLAAVALAATQPAALSQPLPAGRTP